MKNERTVLVVDDEDLLREAIVFLFKREGFDVLSASSGVEALRIIKEQKVDAIVSDIQMPGGNGVDLLKNVKDFDAELPVMVFITAFADLTEADAYALGANAIFSKPFDRKMLVKCIKDSIITKGRPWKKEGESFVSNRFIETSTPAPVGRGGTVIDLPNPALSVGETVDFKIPVMIDAGTPTFKGIGLVRWVENGQAGIEFLELDRQDSETYEKWLNENFVKSFIPKKHAGQRVP